MVRQDRKAVQNLRKCLYHHNTRRKQMRKIIVSMENCQKCEMLKAQCPDAEVVILEPATLLTIARALNIQSLPIVVLANADPQELAKIL